jgi:drug/metabolite transporter (DMT)-like permease
MSGLAILLVLASTAVHAGWNLLLHHGRRNDRMMLQAIVVIAVVGLVPATASQFFGQTFPGTVWLLLGITAVFQAAYYIGLAKGYAAGDFTVVYPVARAMPILFLAVVDITRGRPPAALGWAGIGLVVAGCLLAPLPDLKSIKARHYWNRTLWWALVAAIGTTGYTWIDKLAAEQITAARGSAMSPLGACVYLVFVTVFTIPFLVAGLALLGPPNGKTPATWRSWRLPALIGAMLFLAYWLVLWAYQVSTHTSYVVAARQFSIVIGVAAGLILFRERAAWLRLTAAVVIVIGIVLVGLAGTRS